MPGAANLSHVRGVLRRVQHHAGSAYVGLAVADTLLAGSRRPSARRLRWLTKPLLMPTLTGRFLAATRGRRDRLREGTALAHAFSWGGDVALLGRSEGAFLTGVGSFFAAHVCYIAALRSAGAGRHTTGGGHVQRRAGHAVGPTAAAVVWAAGAPVMAWAAGRENPTLRLPVAGYATVLAGMLAAATDTDPAVPAVARRKIALGGILFVVSDAVLGVEKFLVGGEHPRLDATVMATYAAGQWRIADGVAATE
jgi:uncharacterized membrane protein YhhN